MVKMWWTNRETKGTNRTASDFLLDKICITHLSRVDKYKISNTIFLDQFTVNEAVALFKRLLLPLGDLPTDMHPVAPGGLADLPLIVPGTQNLSIHLQTCLLWSHLLEWIIRFVIVSLFFGPMLFVNLVPPLWRYPAGLHWQSPPRPSS